MLRGQVAQLGDFGAAFRMPQEMLAAPLIRVDVESAEQYAKRWERGGFGHGGISQRRPPSAQDVKETEAVSHG
jgi:hypothetical protein